MGRNFGKARYIALLLVLLLFAAACNGDDEDAPPDPADVQSDFGVDLENQVLRLGVLNDESGPAATIGNPFAAGKRILAEQVNAGGSGLLPEGWTIELVERDHGYNPAESVSAFNEIKDDVLFFAHSFGTPNTVPLMPTLEEEDIVAFPASLSTAMAAHPYTPPIGAPYMVEAEQAVDWAVEDAEGAENVRLAIIYQQDDYGADGLRGVQAAAAFHEIEVVAQIEVAPGETEYTAPVTQLQGADANYVVLTTLPSGTGPILGTALQLGYRPTWIGNTPAWVDVFFNPEVVPPPLYANFHWVTGLPLWGEDLPGMADFLAAYEAYGADHAPDFYILVSYAQGVLALEAFNEALDNGDVTRAGYFEALTSIAASDAAGLFTEPANLTQFPYQTQTDTRVLAPGSALDEWEVLRDFSTPESWTGIE